LLIVKDMMNFLKKYEIWIFLVLAPLLNFVITYLKSKGLIEFFPYTNGRFYALMFLLLFIVKITKGNEGIKNLFRPMLVWKVHPKWYLFGLLFAFTIGLMTLSIVAVYSGDMSILNFELYIPTLKFTLFLLSWAFLGEVVWIGYAVRELSKITKPFYATQIIGFVWSLWWLPSVYINVGVIEDLPVWPLFLNMMGAAGMCAIVYSKTKSGICVLVIQSMLNMSLVLLPISPDAGDHTYTIFAVLYFLIMLVFMYFMPPKINETNIKLVPSK
ncbi:type II CAAX prenyl endopeptidase Rce1 family protein, partial [Maribacter sp.]|uniref:type II CAAX prenyl endopeptidase Rce1 family protein n=1 Tax=Maribacter sp. TaxID=1897614 RepID=UPI0025C68EDE